VECEFVSSLDRLLHGRISPEGFHCRKTFKWKRFIDANVFSKRQDFFAVLMSALDCGQSTPVRRTYSALLKFIVHAKVPHLLANNLECNNHIGEYNLPHFFAFVQAKAFGVDESHLLQDR
jgi:hypothetical protein